MRTRDEWMRAIVALELVTSIAGCTGGEDGGGGTGDGSVGSSADSGSGSGSAGTSSTSSSEGGESSGSSGDTGGGLAPCEDPMPILQAGLDPAPASGFVACADGRIVREQAVACTSPVEPGNCDLDGVGSCSVDADCGANGACIAMAAGPGPFCGCVVSCETDDDCGEGKACVCAGVAGRSSCVPADCRSNADCGDGLCRYAVHPGSCDGMPKLACTAADDACVLDGDCPSGIDTAACYPLDGVYQCVEEGCA